MPPKTSSLKSPIGPCFSKKTWPAELWPHEPRRVDYLIRVHRDELMAAGALVRVGRELVVIGPRYLRWLERQAVNVPDFTIAPNRPTEAA